MFVAFCIIVRLSANWHRTIPSLIVDSHLKQFLAPRITRIQLDRRVPLQLGNEMRRGGLADTRRSGEKKSFECPMAIFAWLFEAGFIVGRPEGVMQGGQVGDEGT